MEKRWEGTALRPGHASLRPGALGRLMIGNASNSKIGPEHIHSHHMTRECHAGVLLAGERLLKYVAKIQSPFLKKRVSSNHREHCSL